MRKENGCSLILVYINIISILFFYFLFVGISLLQKKGEKKERIYVYIKKKKQYLKESTIRYLLREEIIKCVEKIGFGLSLKIILFCFYYVQVSENYFIKKEGDFWYIIYNNKTIDRT